MTAWVIDQFERTIAGEPNESLRKELHEVCPKAEISGDTILEAKITAKGDFVLASHVFYYIPGEEWMANLERLVSWLSPEGTAVIIIQNHESDCMGMLRHFLGKSFNLKELAESFTEKNGSTFKASVKTVPSHITTNDPETAFIIAEFMMNLLPLPNPPKAGDLRAYIEKNFKSNGGYRISCTQDFLEIQPK